MTPWIRRIHVAATAIVGAQLVVWTVTGLAFTLFDFDAMRGTEDRAPLPELDLRRLRIPADEAAKAAGGSCTSGVRTIGIRPLAGRIVYELTCADGKTVLLDAETGAGSTIDQSLAAGIARDAFRGPVSVRSVERKSSEGDEVFVVHLDDRRGTDVSVDASTGRITAWENRSFRRFDWLWSAHVLGYIDRKSPANWPLRIAALVAVVVSGSGAFLLGGRLAGLFGRRRVLPE
jgi:uncharacterized membrane protein YkoI